MEAAVSILLMAFAVGMFVACVLYAPPRHRRTPTPPVTEQVVIEMAKTHEEVRRAFESAAQSSKALSHALAKHPRPQHWPMPHRSLPAPLVYNGQGPPEDFFPQANTGSVYFRTWSSGAVTKYVHDGKSWQPTHSFINPDVQSAQPLAAVDPEQIERSSAAIARLKRSGIDLEGYEESL